MLIDLGHHYPVALDDDSLPLLADMNFPAAAEPMPAFENEEQRDGARKALRYVFTTTGRDGIVVKHLAIRFLLGLEPWSMQRVAKKYGVTRAAISKQSNLLADKLGIPHLRSETSRRNFSRAQLRAWEKRKQKLHHDNGQI